ncbi:MAG: ABC-F family ATP-binding cassette domain-containing protein [Spirochaetia bacterium]
MSLVQLTDVTVSFDERTDLDGVKLSLSRSSRVALTGANGSGKTTLMRIIAGHVQPDSGTVVRRRDARISYLPQSVEHFVGHTVREEAERAFDYLRDRLSRQEELGHILAETTETDEQATDLLHEFHEIQELIEESGFYDREARIDEVLRGLGFRAEGFDAPIEELSAGWRMRAALARVLLEHPDLLLLDEPTNYLDIEAREWLMDFLTRYRGGYLLVSHDRYFLDRATDHVAELFMGDLRLYTGNFSEYEVQRERELEQLRKDYEAQQAYIERLESFINRFRYNASKASLVQSRIKELEKVEPIEIPEGLKPMHVHFPQPTRTGRIVAELSGLEKRYGTDAVFSGIDVHIERGEKVAVVGPNGAGKSTLLRILAGRDQDFGGELSWGTGVKTAYFSQDEPDALDSECSILEEVERDAPTQMVPHLRAMLGAFLFRGDDVFKQVRVLSGGERSRLILVKMLLRPANLLVLDEPTNHLDMSSKRVLADALGRFEGTVVFVSHDRYFMRDVATRVIELHRPDQRKPAWLRDFKDGYDYYLRRTQAEAAAPQAAAGDAAAGDAVRDQATGGAAAAASQRGAPVSRGPAPEQHWAAQKQQKSRARKLEKQEGEILAEIDRLEAEHGSVQEELARPEVYADGEKVKTLTARLEDIDRNRNELTEQWERLAGERELIEEELGG